jgi:hypothetical protein
MIVTHPTITRKVTHVWLASQSLLGAFDPQMYGGERLLMTFDT